MSNTYKGMDISKWQGSVDMAAAMEDGIQFAILRAGYGTYTVDETFAKNAAAANRLGLPIGAYWFSYATSEAEARQEAKKCLSVIAPYKIQYPVCFDFEYDSVNYAAKQGVTITKDLATKIVTAFCDEIEKGGYYAAFYTNYDFANRMFNMQALSRFDYWYARYQPNPDRTDCGLWQYTSTGRVAGIGGNVDLDIAYKNYPQIIQNAGLNRLGATTAPAHTFAKGDKVRVLNAVQYDNGKPFKLYYDTYDVLQVNGDRVVIGIGIVVTAAIHAKNLQLA